MNNALYEIASFMVTRLSTVWRWSHTRHHSDTIIRGRDPKIAVPRPPIVKNIIINFFALKSVPAEFRRLFIHASGRIEEGVGTYLPKKEYYLCGPPAMIRALQETLSKYKVPKEMISFDEF